MNCFAPYWMSSERTGLACCHCRTIPGVANPWGYRPLLLLTITEASSKKVTVGKCSFALSRPRSGRALKLAPNLNAWFPDCSDTSSLIWIT